ncbi:MAG: UDP-N-acetylmuramate dehydrogenase [Nitrospinae bacterium]|nr:UDP-N-acetylmuramate dehydrogenase [Nitrospinota bacterium]
MIKKDEPMDRLTTFRIGGKAAIFAAPRTEEELAAAVRDYPRAGILGGGSNLLVADAGVPAVISMEAFDDVGCAIAGGGAALVTAGAGYSLTALSRWAYRSSMGGLEFAFGIPGSVGGAVVMNAGAHGAEVKDCLTSARLLVDGRFEDVAAADLGLSYRSSALPEGAVVVSATFRLAHGAPKEILGKMKEWDEARKNSQPLELPSAGSVFKNPPGGHAGKIIDGLGLKGLRVGDAQVSEKHANFIVNLGNATAAQVKELIETVEAAVLEKTGIRLEREIKLMGNFLP